MPLENVFLKKNPIIMFTCPIKRQSYPEPFVRSELRKHTLKINK